MAGIATSKVLRTAVCFATIVDVVMAIEHKVGIVLFVRFVDDLIVVLPRENVDALCSRPHKWHDSVRVTCSSVGVSS